MERVFHHSDVWTSTFKPWFLPGADGEFCVLDEAEGHGRHQISVTTTAVMGAAQVSAYLRVTLALTGN